jgi:hypothetical protein
VAVGVGVGVGVVLLPPPHEANRNATNSSVAKLRIFKFSIIIIFAHYNHNRVPDNHPLTTNCTRLNSELESSIVKVSVRPNICTVLHVGSQLFTFAFA